MSGKDLSDFLIHALLAIFGMAARELRYKDEKKIAIERLISNAVIASFGATIVLLVSSMSNLPPQIGYISAGLVGWGGPQIIDKVFDKNVDLAKDKEEEPSTQDED